ncbi:hypothetical protein DESC_240067 [Desulfosarcina cetonica]|uniref:hypothetical protein n=1 Tax=Desulfosarcina cetonica TaxID=90730 RepID=UPI0006D14D2D|nr:hypothetical protein [Desulfosarcina cetonica]VTR64676.1 hypothetical protein DESC_240067 [Desulfosarcina cetonica]
MLNHDNLVVDAQHARQVAECIANKLDDGFVICISETTHHRPESIRAALRQIRPEAAVTIIADRDFARWVHSRCRVLIANIHALGIIDLGKRRISAVCIATRPVMADDQPETMFRLLAPAQDGAAPELVSPYPGYVQYVRSRIENYKRLQNLYRAV